jgi:hypothetical protein
MGHMAVVTLDRMVVLEQMLELDAITLFGDKQRKRTT